MKKRLSAHGGGAAGAKYTRANPPVRVVCCWKISDAGGRGPAMKVESFIKSLTRQEKEILIAQPGLLKKLLKQDRGLEVKIKKCGLNAFSDACSRFSAGRGRDE